MSRIRIRIAAYAPDEQSGSESAQHKPIFVSHNADDDNCDMELSLKIGKAVESFLYGLTAIGDSMGEDGIVRIEITDVSERS